EVLRMVEDALAEAGLGSRAWSADGVEAGAHLGGASRRAPVFQAGSSHTVKDTEQLGILLGCEGLEEGHDDRFVYSVLLTMLGGGMSSRLFQSVREERGLAYAVNCVASQFTDSGTFGIYAGCTAENAQAVVDLALAEWDRLAQEAPSRSGPGGTEPIRARRDRLPAVGVDGPRTRVLGGADESAGEVGDLRPAARSALGPHRADPLGHRRRGQRHGRSAAGRTEGIGHGRPV